MNRQPLRHRAPLMIVVLAGGCALLSGCVGAGSSPSAAASAGSSARQIADESQSPTPTLSASEPDFTPRTAAPTSDSDTSDDLSDTTCSAVLPKGAPVPASTTAPAAPAGAWSSVNWQKLPENALPNEFINCAVDGIPSASVDVFGWSKGFVALELGTNDSGQVDNAIPYASSDGLTWHRGKPISFAAIDEDSNGPDDFYMVEGPAGLAIIATEEPAVCGWEPPILDAVLKSQDGLNWSFINLQPFDGDANYVGGGGAGYLMTGAGSQGDVGVAWTSSDLVIWHKVALDSAGFKGSLIQGAAVFSGGFVMTGYSWSQSGCTDPLAPNKPAAWLSADGVSWSPVNLPGSLAGANVETNVIRITDQLLLVEASTSKGGKVTVTDWISSDGASWSQIPDPGPDVSQLIEDGVRAFEIHCPDNSVAGCQKSQPTIQQLDSNLVAKTVAQTGFAIADLLPESWPGDNLAVGPTGFVYVDDDGTVWFGSPTP